MTVKSQSDEFEAMVKTLWENTATIKFGEIVLALRVHDGRVVAITHSVTKNSIEKVKGDKSEKE